MSQFSPFSWLLRSANLRIGLSFLLGLTFIGLAAQPTFVNLPSNTTVGCEDDLPSAETVTALSDCPGNVQVNAFIAETGSPVSTCSVSTAFGPGIDWAVWLPVLAAPSVAWNFIGNPSLVFYANGTGRLTGTIQNAANSTWQMNVDVFFENGREWAEWSALGRNYKNDFGLAGSNYINWSYYELNPVFSHFTGIGVLEGSELSLQHMPANYYFGFQVGLGANNKNANQGLSGWFTYTGTFNGASVNGNGDINVDKVCENVDPACGSSEFTYLFRAEDACGAVAYAESVVSRLDDVAPVFGAVESPVYVSCLQSNNTFVSATDACSSVNISFSDDVQIAGCPGIINRTYTATDGCGNSSQVSQVIYLLDEGVLEFTTFPADATISCSDEATLNPVVEYNAVCVNTTLTQSEEIIAGSCAANYTLIRTYVLSDDCGNSVSRTWTVQVADTEAPAITGVPLSVTLSCGDEVPSGAPTASDNCSDFTLTSNTIVTQEECGSTSTTIWTAMDACGNVSTAQQLVVIADNTPPVFLQAPTDIVLTCGAITQNGSDPVVEDDCSAVSVTYSDEVIGEQPCEGSIIRHWVAVDACGNASTFDQTLEFSDSEVPVFDFVASPVTVDCSALASLSATVSDNCSNVSVSFSDEVLVQGCPGVIVRTYTATDGCGNTAQAQQTIYTITESGAPEFTTFPADAAITCSEAFSLNPVVEYNAGCVNTILTQSEEIIAGTCDANYTLIRTYVLTDDCGNSISRTWTVQVTDTEAPAITGVPLSANLNCGDEVPSGTPTASDNCSDFTLTSNTVVTQVECGSSTITTWTATDACGNVSSAQQVVSIDYSIDPFFTYIPASVTISCGEQFELDTAIVSQSCSNVTLTWTDQPLDDCAGSYIRVWRAFDGCGNQAIESTVVTVVDQESPVLIGVPAEQQASCGSELVLPQVSAVDNCDSDVEVIVTETTQPAGCGLVTIYTWTATDDCGNTVSETRQFSFTDNESPVFVELPSNISAACGIIPADAPMPIVTDDCSDVVITYVDEALPGAACSGSILRTWTATDACGNASSAEQIISYVDNVAPVITSYPDDTTVGCDLIPFASESDISFEDNCNAAVVSIIDAFIPGGCPAGYNIERTYTVIDACANSTSVMQTIYVVDEVAPVIFGMPSDTTIACGDELPITEITATDNCSSNEEITFALDEQYIPSDCGAAILRVYSASDACGNTTSITQNIYVVDASAPFFTYIPASVTISCGEQFELDTAIVSQSCSNVTLTWTDQPLDDCAGSYIRVWRAFNGCGNQAIESTVVTVVDEESPVLIGVPAEQQSSCGSELVLPQVSAVDNCDSDVEVIVTETTQPAGCGLVTIYTWTATDDCGNTVSETRQFSFTDNESPIFVELPSNISAACGIIPVDAPMPIVTDDCSDVVITYVDEALPGAACSGSILRTWTATDACGNASSAEQIISYEDNVAPVITSYPDDTTVGCDLIPFASESDISFEDNCNAAVVSIIDAFIPGGCPAGYNIERTYTVIDACGNSTSVMQTIYVVDEVAPVIFGMPSDTTIACGDELPIAAITATDNCSSNEDITFAVEEQYIPSDCGATILRVYSASDACGNTTSIVQNINVVDLVAPVFVSFPVSASVSCEDAVAVEYSPISFTESCSQVTVTWQEEIIEGDCPSNYTSVRTCTLTDECGNSTVASYTLNVSDTQAPILTGVPSDITLECGDNIPAAQVDVWDNCSAQPQLFFSEAMETIGCNTYYTRRWTALDECGNLSQDVQVVTFIDETAPTLSAYPESTVLQCGQTPAPAPVLTANDNCSDNVQVVFTETPISNGSCGGLQRTWCATDCSGNEECHTQTITYQPQALPMSTRAQLQAWQSATNRIALELVAHESARWTVDLLDMNGRRIDTWFAGDMSAGETREINADVDFLPSGIYFVQFSNGTTAITQRLPIVRN